MKHLDECRLGSTGEGRPAPGMAQRKGFGVRLDKPGVRASGGKATDIETCAQHPLSLAVSLLCFFSPAHRPLFSLGTRRCRRLHGYRPATLVTECPIRFRRRYVTEYLRDKLADAEDTLKSGGGDTRLLQQQLSAMEAEVSAAVRQSAEVDMLRSQVQDKDEQIAILRPGGGGGSGELQGRLEQLQQRVRELEQENAIITRERELGVSTVAGSVSQETYDLLVAENKRLALQIERGELDGGGGLGSADLEDLKALKRDVKKMKQEREELQRKYEAEVARRRQLEEQGPLGGFATENPTTIKELRDKMAALVVENKRLNATAQGSHQVMFDAQHEVEQKTVEMDKLRMEKESEIAALVANMQQAQQDWGKEKQQLLWEQKEQHKGLEESLQHERNSATALTQMCEELATTLESEVRARTHWEQQAKQAMADLATACQLQGIEVPQHSQWQNDFAPPQQQQQLAYGGQQGSSAAGYGQLGLPPQQQPPPPQSGYSYAGQPQQGYQQQLHIPEVEAPPASMASYQPGP